MMSLSFLFGRSERSSLFERSRNCVLTSITLQGRPQAHKVRVAACSDDHAHLWFVISKGSSIAADVARQPNVMLSVLDRDSHQLVHVSGEASVAGKHPAPLYLAPDFQQAQALTMHSDDAEIALLRVDLGQTRGDSLPPHRIFRLFQTARDPLGNSLGNSLGNVSDTGTPRGSQ
jgi:hypothetical protein